MDRNVSMTFLQCVFCILMCYLVGVCAQDCPSRPKTDAQRLIHDLFCNYDKTAMPKKSDTTNADIRITLVLKEFFFYTYTDELNAHFFSVISWIDKKLSWDRASYGGLNKVDLDSNLIWMPEIAILNTERVHEGEMGISGALCLLMSNGLVHCTVSSRVSIPCSADIARFPFDSQSCKILIKPWTRSSDDYNLIVWSRFNSSLLAEDIYIPSREWDLQQAKFVKVTTRFENATYSYIRINMQMKRHGNLYEATCVLPGLVIALVTLLSFWMDCEIDSRFCLCSTAIVMDCLYLQYLGYTLHHNGASCPLIVLFYRDHLLASAAALLITFIVRWMYGTELQVPILATSIVHPIFNSRPASWLLLVEPMTDEVQQKKQQWQPLALILDRVSFVAFSITFLILYFICF